jgi:hypothetical protein
VSDVAIPARAAGDSLGGRADIVLAGLEHAGPSFELRVFLNNPAADGETETDLDQGFAGSVYVYGYGTPPPGGEHIPITRSLAATEAVRAAAGSAASASVTLVPVGFGADTPEVDLSTVGVSVQIHD